MTTFPPPRLPLTLLALLLALSGLTMGVPATVVAQGTIDQSIGDDGTITQSIGSDQEPDDGGPIVGEPPSTDCASRGPAVNLSLCDFSNANLSAVNLRYANLSGANLRGADLRGSDLTNANMNPIYWTDTICPDGINSDTNGYTCDGHLTPR